MLIAIAVVIWVYCAGIDPDPPKSLVVAETAVPVELVSAGLAVSSALAAPIVLDHYVLAGLVSAERHAADAQSLEELAVHPVNHELARALGAIVRTDGDAPWALEIPGAALVLVAAVPQAHHKGPASDN